MTVPNEILARRLLKQVELCERLGSQLHSNLLLQFLMWSFTTPRRRSLQAGLPPNKIDGARKDSSIIAKGTSGGRFRNEGVADLGESEWFTTL
jgi:hypothetical protein